MTSDDPRGNPLQPQKAHFWGIRARLIMAFGLAMVLLLAVIDAIQFFGIPGMPGTGRAGHFKREASRTMELIADMKEERLRWWVDERCSDLRVFVAAHEKRAQVETLSDSVAKMDAEGLRDASLRTKLRKEPEYAALATRLREIARTFREYQRVFIADTRTHRILLSTDEGDEGTDVRGQVFIVEPEKTRGDYVGDVRWMQQAHSPVLHVSDVMCAPKDNNRVIAVMVIEIRTEDTLVPLLHTGEGLGAGGEALLMDQDRWILASLKHSLSDGSRPRPLEYQLQTEAAERATQSDPGEHGVIEALDYRGVPVLAAYRNIVVAPGLRWGLVVKRDRAELYAPLWEELRDSLWLGLAGIAAAMAMTVLVARTVTRPILALAATAQDVSHGDLNARAPVTTRDEVGMLAATFNDMIQRIQDWQQALVRQERMAALGHLTATVSHEIRNPLGTIRTSLFVVSQRIRGKGLGVEAALDRMERSIARCDAIIVELLDFGRIRPLDRETTDADSWLAALLDEQDIPPHVTVTRDLASGVRLPLDRERLRRCLVNLLTNASHAMEPAGGRLVVASRAEDSRLVVRVSDTGCGISPGHLQKIFEPLYSTKTFGVGLGLAIVKQIVDQHEGTIEVESQPGHGTTFTVRLPILTHKETTV
jgi:signal transduction histidine kinase